MSDPKSTPEILRELADRGRGVPRSVELRGDRAVAAWAQEQWEGLQAEIDPDPPTPPEERPVESAAAEEPAAAEEHRKTVAPTPPPTVRQLLDRIEADALTLRAALDRAGALDDPAP